LQLGERHQAEGRMRYRDIPRVSLITGLVAATVDRQRLVRVERMIR
jgi:hypothetical protein